MNNKIGYEISKTYLSAGLLVEERQTAFKAPVPAHKTRIVYERNGLKGSYEWTKGGILHRTDGPTVIYNIGSRHVEFCLEGYYRPLGVFL